MSSTTTTMSKIKTSAPPPIYMTPPWIIRPCVQMRSYLISVYSGEKDHSGRDAGPLI
jgi:hypothetical protein